MRMSDRLLETRAIDESDVQDVETSHYRWVILVMCFLIMMTSYTVRIAWSNAAATVSRDLSLTATMLGAVVTAFFCGYVITNAIAGIAIDRYGAKIAVSVSLLPLALSVAGFGAIQTLGEGLAAQVVMGLCAGLDFAATTKLAAGWFPLRERGRAFGILSTSSSSSLIVSNFLFPKIIEGASWQFLYYGLGGVVLCIAILCTFIVREAPNVSAAKKLITEETFFQIVRKLVHDRNYIFLTLVYFGANWGTWGVILWSNALMVKGHGFTNVGAGEVTMLIGVGGFIAKPTYGWLSDSLPFRRKTMLFPCFVGFVAVLLMFGAADTEWKFRMLAPFVGVFAFVCQPLIIAMLTEFVDKKKLGTASGVMNALGQSSTIVAPLIVGGAFQATGSFFGAFAALAVGPLLSLVCVCLIREPNRYSLR